MESNLEYEEVTILCTLFFFFFFFQRQQVVMTRKWAEAYPKIHFFSMHPGWADTPGM